jgi:chromate reductase
MSRPVRILGIAGSLRRESYNRAALRAAADLVPEGATDIFELDGIPGFNQDEEARPPAAVVDLKRRIRAADALLIATPEYNYSVPGVLKNAIDWASRPYVPINQPEVMIGNAATRFDAQGNLVDEATKGFVRKLLENLVAWTKQLQQVR